VGFHLSPFLHLVSQSSSRYLCLWVGSYLKNMIFY
jgi:hypothetical protein